jgi:hypothetical protein
LNGFTSPPREMPEMKSVIDWSMAGPVVWI